MATRSAVAASIASAVLFSSLLISNIILFSGAAQSLRYDSLAAEERAYYGRAIVVRSIAGLDLLDGSQALLSSSNFECSDATLAVSRLLATERVNLNLGGFSSVSDFSLAADSTTADNLTTLRPFAGAVSGLTNMMATSWVQGRSADGSVVYRKSEAHLMNLPLRLSALTADCIDAASRISSVLGALGVGLCNSTILSQAMSSVSGAVSLSGRLDGFSVTVDYGIVSTQPCGVEFVVSALQAGILGPTGPFAFIEEETGFVWA